MKTPCPACHLPVDIPDHCAGWQVKCSSCGQLFDAPRNKLPAATARPSVTETVSARSQWPQEPIQIAVNIPRQEGPRVTFNERERLGSGGWFARSFMTTGGIIIALFVFSFGTLFLICGGCLSVGIFSNGAGKIAREATEREQQKTVSNLPEIHEPPFSKERPISDPSDLPLTGFGEPSMGEVEKEPQSVVESTPFDPLTVTIDPAQEPDRTKTFQSDDKKFSVDAVFVALHNKTVYLKKSTGKIIEVPIEKLSLDDRLWVRKIAAADRKRKGL